MKARHLILGTVLLAAGCAPFQETYYLDREFGKDSRAAWDAQIINKDQRYGEAVPEGLAGINAEESMAVRTKGFAEKPRKANIFQLDLTGQK